MIVLVKYLMSFGGHNFYFYSAVFRTNKYTRYTLLFNKYIFCEFINEKNNVIIKVDIISVCRRQQKQKQSSSKFQNVILG